MNRFVLTLVALAATASLTSCSDQPEPASPPTSTATTSKDATPGVDNRKTGDLSGFTASLLTTKIAKASKNADWYWYLGEIEVSDDTVKVPLGEEKKADAVEVCKVVQGLLAEAEMPPMQINVSSIETSFPIALADPDSRFETGCHLRS